MKKWILRYKPSSEGQWWLAQSTRSAEDLHRACDRGLLASWVTDCVKEVKGGVARNHGLFIVYLRIAEPQHNGDRYLFHQCLTEAGVGLIDQLPKEGV